MSFNTKLFIGDVGTKVIVDCGISLAGATKVEFKILKPSGATASWTAAVQAPAADGLAYYYITSTDLNEEGKWKISAAVEYGSAKFTGECDLFWVYNRFNDITL